MRLDHLILPVNDVGASIAFYTHILGFRHEGDRPPFAVLRVTPDFVIQLAPWGSKGGEHLAFAVDRPELDRLFRGVREAGIAYGDAFERRRQHARPGAGGRRARRDVLALLLRPGSAPARARLLRLEGAAAGVLALPRSLRQPRHVGRA